MMVGQATKLNIERPEPKNTKKLLEVTNLSVVDRNDVTKLKDVSFTAYGGEILGIAGISGCGQKELMEAIAGLQPVTQGSVLYYEADGTPEELIGKSPMKIQEMGVHLSFVPEDRLGMGLVANMGMTGNMMLRSFKKGKFGFSDRKAPAELAERIKEDLEVVTTGHYDACPADVRRQRPEGAGGARNLPLTPECCSPLTPFVAWTSTPPTPSIACSTSRRPRASPLSMWARTWTCCWSCATAFWCCAAVRFPVS